MLIKFGGSPMFRSVQNSTILSIMTVILFLLITLTPVAAHINSVVIPTDPISESKDYATLAWRDPWDMNEYSDVSQYINESGNRDVVRNINVSNGVFSATSFGSAATAGNGWFFTLFPGYETTIHTSKAASFHPVSSSEYGCLYIAMKTDSTGDQYRAFWFADDRLNTGGASWGVSNGVALPSVPIWNLYKINLSDTSTTVPGYTHWVDNPTWQGIRIDPTIKANINYAIDWVRLTPCTPPAVLTNITFTPDNGINSIWMRPEGTNRHIRVGTDVAGSSGSYNLDTQGIQPGRYYVGFGDGFTCCVTESIDVLTINQTPVVDFVNPTFYSGQDYATTAGNAWDMDSPEDYIGVDCTSYGQGYGVLWINTLPNTAQPPECVGSTPPYVADPKIHLNVPISADPSQYRYLTFRSLEEGDWQYVSGGSITRWVWTVQGSSGRPGYECHLVSQDIAHDVGWGIYTIDLWDAFAGSAEGWAGECDLPLNWKQSSLIHRMRFDPNENITDHNFYNEIDWIRLTKPISIQRGNIFTIGLNKHFSDDVFDVALFYTTNPDNQPTQHPVVLYTPPPPPDPIGPFAVYLPIIKKSLADPFLNGADLEYQWDTASVSSGEYYICVHVFDDYNEAVFCSDATITVTP